MNFRKGIDIFAEVACDVLSRENVPDDVHFVWVGDGATHYDSAFYWAAKSIRDRGFEARVHFAGERRDTEPFFLAADLFLLTSRADPYPCVIQEAMGCAVPVISFAGKSGAAEAYQDSGVTVPFGVGPMADAVQALLKDDARLEKLRQRGMELHQAKWPLSGYAEAIFGLAGRAAPIIARKLNERVDSEPVDRADQPEVLIALSSWDYNEQNLFAEHAVKLLRQGGYDARLLFTRGAGTFNRGDTPAYLPEVPFSFLHPKTQDIAHVQEALYRYFSNSRRRSVFVPYSANGCLHAISNLPRHVSSLAILHGDNDVRLEDFRQFATYFNHIICTAPSVRAELVKDNASLKRKLSFLTARIAVAPRRSQVAIAARARRKANDPIRVVSCGFDSLDAALNGVRLVRLLKEEQVPFAMTMFANTAEVGTVRSVASDLIRCGLLSLLENPAREERWSVLEQADVLVFGAEAAGSELGVVEGMAFGCIPIVSNSEKEHIAGLKHEESCLFFEGTQLRKVARLISELQSDHARLTALTKGAYKAFREELANEERLMEGLVQSCVLAFEHRDKQQVRHAANALQMLDGT